MSIFGKIKKRFGYTWVEVTLKADDVIDHKAKIISGKIVVTHMGEEELEIKKVSVVLSEKYTRNSGNKTSVVYYTLSKRTQDIWSTFAPWMSQSFSFVAPFDYKKWSGPAQVYGEGILWGLSKMLDSGKKINKKFTMVAKVDLKGVAMDPKVKKVVTIK